MVGLIAAVGGCAASGSRTADEDAPQIGLRRGARWSVLTIRPPHLTGPNFHLVLKDGVLAGSVASPTAPRGSMRVRIGENHAEGYGPLGPVSMDFVAREDSLAADGMWNGGRVHIVFTQTSLKGTVADNSSIMSRGDPEATQGMQVFRGRRSGSRGANANTVDPLPNNTSCEYFLTERGSDGALSGGSICSGMPQQTRLEVPKVAQSYLTRAELATVLVAVLSAPPDVAAENLGPSFTDPGTDMIRRR